MENTSLNKVYITIDEAARGLVVYKFLQRSAKSLHELGITDAYLLAESTIDGLPSKNKSYQLLVVYLKIAKSSDEGSDDKFSISNRDSPIKEDDLTTIYTSRKGFHPRRLNAILAHCELTKVGIIVPKKTYARKLEELISENGYRFERVNYTD